MKDVILNTRLDKNQLSRIKEACKILERTPSNFIRWASLEKANRILKTSKKKK